MRRSASLTTEQGELLDEIRAALRAQARAHYRAEAALLEAKGLLTAKQISAAADISVGQIKRVWSAGEWPMRRGSKDLRSAG